ncbi:MAG: PAS domain-containing protein [Deltaproteobacteria bacterium]|nr:PAS domain-containing protein [Deltaproteobacteria bacterium]
MVSPLSKTPPPELPRRLQILMLMRVLFVSLLLGALIFIQARETRSYFGDIHSAHFFLLAAVYIISIVYVLLLRLFRNILLQAYVQLLFDSLFITLFVYITGGIDSIFSFLYILNIFSGSILLYRKGGMVIASSSSILYGLLLDLHYYGVLPPFGTHLSASLSPRPAYLFYTIITHMAGFYLVAFLSSHLSEQARKTRFELRAKEMDLDKLEGLKEGIINSMNSGLIVLNREREIILFNPAAESLFKTRSTQVQGRPLYRAVPFLDPTLVEENLKMGSFGSQSPYVDIPYAEPNQPVRYLRLSVHPLRYAPGGDDGLILVFQDVTRIREVEDRMKTVEGLAEVGELAAGIAHEIRNPMASISGSIEMLKDGIKLNEVNRRLMDIVSREIDRLDRLITDFLGFARPRRPTLETLDLNQLILDSLELVQNNQEWAKDIKIVTHLQRPLEIESDPHQIRQLLWNLFLNAGEALGDAGDLRITTLTGKGSAETGEKWAEIVIRDSGKGFADHPIAYFFKPFSTTKKEGSGLGLATVKRITQLLGGEVSARNHPEGGAEITIRLPVVPAPARAGSQTVPEPCLS